MKLQKYQKCSKVTRGLRKAEFVLKNARIVNVFTREILEGDIAIQDGMIVGIGNYQGEEETDLGGRYVCPGFIDSHLHLESTLVTPAELVTVASRHGTTTFIVDPHESANVSGLKGIDYILNQTEKSPANVYVMMPSCVPSTSVDDNGCVFSANDLYPYVRNPRVLGLGEVMDDPAVIHAEESMFVKMNLFENRTIDGHAPYLPNKELSAYKMAGVDTDHEATTFEYALEEVRRGLHVHIREGSAAHNLKDIVEGIVRTGIDTEYFSFCTDDKHIEDILRDGHIDYSVKMAVKLGLDPIRAIKMATINTAKCYGLTHLGAIAPGYQADLLVVDNLEKMTIQDVYYKGRKIDQDGEIIVKECPSELKNTVHVGEFSKEDLRLESPDGIFNVVGMQEGEITTVRKNVQILHEMGVFTADEQYQKIAVVERHKATGKTGVGVVSGFGIQGGAIASSVSHDSHNIIVIGDNDEDMYLAVQELIRTQGGYTLVADHHVYDTLELPIMGLMSDAGFQYSHRKLERMIRKAHEMGVPDAMAPFITLSFMALPVIPEIRVTPRGIYNVCSGEFYQN